ncbi:MAG: hypothetical protein SYC29_10700 [Planctomycetota bacterium]|nr:hypothetical protein [Planctomycetota bacterium]
MLTGRQARLGAAMLGMAAGVVSMSGADGPVSLENRTRTGSEAHTRNEPHAAVGRRAPNAPPGRSAVAYVSWSGGEPFDEYGNVNALDDVFGPQQWKRLDFPTAVENELWEYDMIIMDGSAQGDHEFVEFVDDHRAEMESWVAAGGSLIINAARWYELDALDLGFGMVLRNGHSDDAIADDTSHPVCDGPYGTTGSFFEGGALAHDYITGEQLTSLLTGEVEYPVLAERYWGGGHVIAGGLTLPFFGEHELWSDNCAILHRNMLAHACDMIGQEEVKYRQPPNRDSIYAFYSNVNCNWNPWVRYEDFICRETGEINRIAFWGIVTLDADSPVENVAAFEIETFKWLEGGPCGFLPGSLGCSYEIPADDVSCRFAFMMGDWAVHKYSVNLPEPCWQEYGLHYLLRIAAILEDPDSLHVFSWWPSSIQYGTEAASYDDAEDEWGCDYEDDQAFELYAEPGEPYPKETLLYDVDFDEPPHYPGLPPALGDGPAPRETATEIPFGEPLVVESWHALVQQPCAFGDHPDDNYEQLTFATYQGGEHGFPDAYPAYRVRLDVLVLNDVTLKIYVDCPTAHHVLFDSWEKIRAVVMGDEGYDIEIGAFYHGAPVSLEMQIDHETQTWRILLDDREAFVGPYPSSDPLRSLRLSLMTNWPSDPVAVDNIMIWGIGESCPADFDGNGVVDTADLLFLLGCWGTECGDVNGDGTTNTADLLELLGAWGECP